MPLLSEAFEGLCDSLAPEQSSPGTGISRRSYDSPRQLDSVGPSAGN
jgi:hypothetical protein